MTTRPHIAQKPPAGVFLATTVVIFFLTLSAADSVGFVPYYIDGTPPRSASAMKAVDLAQLPTLGNEPTHAQATLPVRIKIAAINLDLPVQNPDTRDIAALDAVLVNGPARYVDSAQLGVSGNVLVFAHSSHLPIVHNQMFKAFNRVPELKGGETIVVTGADGHEYRYRVDSVRQALASEETIDLRPTTGTKLTLVTCDTLTSKDARFILEATLVGTRD